MVAAIGAKTAVVSTSVGLAHEDLEPLASAGHAGRCVSLRISEARVYRYSSTVRVGLSLASAIIFLTAATCFRASCVATARS